MVDKFVIDVYNYVMDENKSAKTKMEARLDFMSEKETKILDIFGKAIPKLSELEKEKLLAFGEGMAFMVERKDPAKAPDTATAK